MDLGVFVFNGSLLASCRLFKNVSQSVLGELVGCSRQTISSIERGEFQPSVNLYMRICRYFEVDPFYFLIIL